MFVEASAAVLTAVVAVVAAVYASRQVRLARLDRDDRNRPFVTVTLRPSHGIVASIVIRNEGATMARNVKLAFDPEWESTNPKRTGIRDAKLWREGMPNLAPGQEIVIFADTFPDRFDSELPHAYTVTVSCDGRQRRFGRKPFRLTEQYVLDFDIFYGYSTATVYEIHDIADALRGIRSTVKSWSETAGGRLSVVARDGDAQDATERQADEAWRAAHREPTVEAPAPESDTLTTADLSSTVNAQAPISRPRAVRRPKRAPRRDEPDTAAELAVDPDVGDAGQSSEPV
ncbi:hypothetical protein [Cellulomonas sp. S1-8]|uniref:hypothetical protein n=1 Tax=Cellulomonas sp. S1-8 TaxID=2904790 RepID=UPI002243300D|nr:hypothetical protein [Cellulomonas sp. S1-8]UZN02868.1 hypothetical protein OKX07_17720 [Cellulomonas sp. S1-8]